jgi:sugar phosphate isomerase/epimerase
MPWMLPDSADSYERLLRAVDRDAFGVHFDPVNLVCSPRLYFDNGRLIRDFIRRLGHRIRSCHAKDIRLGDRLTVHLDEVAPGSGGLDYRTLLTDIEAVDSQMPLLIEHLDSTVEYVRAAEHIRAICDNVGVEVIAPTAERTWAGP